MKTVFLAIWVYYVPLTDTTYMTWGASFLTREDCDKFVALNHETWVGAGNPVSRSNSLCVEIPNETGKDPLPFVDPRK